ncbi:hypothetical protein ACF06N_23600 [Streptomyces albidoflavus]
MNRPPRARTPLSLHLFPTLGRRSWGPVALTMAVAAGGAAGAVGREAAQTVWPPEE